MQYTVILKYPLYITSGEDDYWIQEAEGSNPEEALADARQRQEDFNDFGCPSEDFALVMIFEGDIGKYRISRPDLT